MIFLLSLIATSSTVIGASEKPLQQVITESDNGNSIILKNEDIFYLKLRENPSTGASWLLKLSPGLCILSDNYTQDPAPEDYTGVPGTHQWEIKVVASGSQQIKGIYKHPWENTTGTEENFTLNINDVNQNTTSNNRNSGNETSNNSELLERTGEGTYAYITNEYENTVSVINTTTDTIVATVNVGSNPVEIAVSPDGSKVYVANYYGSTVSVIETASNTVTATFDVGDNPNGIAVSPDGKKIYIINILNMSVIDTATNTVIDTIGNVVSIPQGITINKNGTKIYLPNTDITTFFAIDTATKEVTEIPVEGSCGVAVNPEGTKLYVTSGGEYPDKGIVEVVDVASNTVTAKAAVGGNPGRVAVSPDGARVYVTNEGSNSVSVIDTSTNNVIATVNVGINPNGIAVTPDGKKVYVANHYSNNISVIDTALNKVTATLNVGNGPTGVALGKLNVTSSETGNATNIKPNSKPAQSPNTCGTGNTKTPCFEVVYGIVSLLAVFCIKKTQR